MMLTLRQQPRLKPARLLWLDVALALLAALAYLLIALRVLGVGALQPAEDGGAIVYVAAGCYFVGGLLILARRRGLWIAGAVINALVMLFFFMAYQDRPAVLLSSGGLATKAAQILLEIGLLTLIVTDWLRTRRRTTQPDRGERRDR